ncbi:MAG: putative amidohydrolase [Candidatus Poriferisodalaceae bacterium]|jgi:predicted amidohydrolase
MRLACIQHDLVWEDPKPNFQLITPKVECAIEAKSQLVVLSELVLIA